MTLIAARPVPHATPTKGVSEKKKLHTVEKVGRSFFFCFMCLILLRRWGIVGEVVWSGSLPPHLVTEDVEMLLEPVQKGYQNSL
jgi:hypothetical protein